MSAKKGVNNFKKIQDNKIKENTIKIENALSIFPHDIPKITLSKVIHKVADITGLHFTTIRKNENYTKLCNDKFISMTIKSKRGNKKEIPQEDSINRLLVLENVNLKNQITSLTNVIKRLEENQNSAEPSEDKKYEEKFNLILNHFKDHIEIKDGNVYDPYSEIRAIFLCKL